MITELTKEQLDQIPAFVEKWLKIGLATGPVEMERAKVAATKAYEAAGLKPPKYFFTFKSPLSAAIAAAFLKQMTKAQIKSLLAAKPEDLDREQLLKGLRASAA